MARIVVTVPGERVVEEFTALVKQPVAPATARPVDIGLVEISHTQPTELLIGPPGPPGAEGPPGPQGPPGTGSSDADTLDGQDGTYYLNFANQTGTISSTQHGNLPGGSLHALANATTPGFFVDAASDGIQYVRKNAAWSPVSVPPGTVISDTPPGSPAPGQLWFESDSGNTYIWVDDGSSQQWVQVNVGMPGGLAEAPIDGNVYGRLNAAWTEIPGIGGISPTEYNLNTSAYVPPPNTNNMRLNNVNQTLATAMYIHHVNAMNVDVGLALKMIRPGNTLLIQDKSNSANYQYYTVSAAITDFATYATVPVAWSSGGSPCTAGRVMLAAFGLGIAEEVIGGSITIGTVAPSSPAVNDVWIDTNRGGVDGVFLRRQLRPLCGTGRCRQRLLGYLSVHYQQPDADRPVQWLQLLVSTKQFKAGQDQQRQ
jgi:hypothetical protein